MTKQRAYGDVCLLPMSNKSCQQGRKGRSRSRTGWIAAALIAVFAFFAPVQSNAAIGASLVTSIADGTDTSSYDFSSETYSNNVLYIAFTCATCASGQDCGLGVDIVAAVESVSGAGLNFTEIGPAGGVTFSTMGRRIQAWRALGTSGAGTGAVTVTMQTDTISASMGAAMIEVTGTKTSGTNGSDAIVQWPTNSASGVSSLTVNMAAFADSNNRPVAFFSHRADSDSEVTTHDTAEGYTELHDGPHGSVMMAHMAEWHATAANTTPSASWTSSKATGGFALEIAAESGPTAPTIAYSNNTTAQSGQSNPSGITDPTPAFSAIYNDPDSGDIANKYRVQVNTQSDFNGTMMWDSGTSGTSMDDTTEGSRCPDIIYAGSALSSDTTYYWRIKFWDDEGGEGVWNSTAQSFQTATIPAACDIAFRSASPAVTADTGGVSVDMPAGTLENDIMIFAATSWDDVALSFPAGWTTFHESFDHNVRVTLAWKRAVAGESGPYAVTRTGGGKIIAAIASFSGAITFGSPIDAGPEHQHTSGGATTTAPSITTTVEGAMVVMTSHVDNDRTHSDWGCATDPSSLIEGFDYNDSDVVSVALAYPLLSTV